jgi:hypothetical protein
MRGFMKRLELWLPQGKWVNEDVGRQLGEQYNQYDDRGYQLRLLTAMHRLTKSIYKVSELTGVNRATVWLRLKKHGETTNLGCKPWTRSEDELLRRFYPQVITERCKVSDIAKKINRTEVAVEQHAADLEINGSRGCVTKDKSRAFQLSFRWTWLGKDHPRGMKGKTHTDATKEKISQFHSGKVVPRELVEKILKTRLARYGTLAPQWKQPGRSWKSEWREIGGKRCFFRSTWEANYARYLEFLKVHGNILDWDHEPETFWFEGIKRGCVSYLPDFKVANSNGKIEYHEVKGWMCDRSATKIKRMEKYYPDIKLVLIDGKWFKRNRNKLRGLVPGWESGK